MTPLMYLNISQNHIQFFIEQWRLRLVVSSHESASAEVKS